MFSSIRTSIKNKNVVTDLTRKIGLGPENTVARLAFAYSLAKGRNLDLQNIQDSKGKEYSKNVLFGKNLTYYVALICQQYNIYKTDKDIPKYIKLHIDDGLELLSKEYDKKRNVSGLDFVLSLIDQGLKN
ncbi:MAG: DndE family protein [Ignavibacterium sp.]|jgi:DNA sulfur modification protein DndE|nr:DndE family protein [Ignavibacterium sp.]